MHVASVTSLNQISKIVTKITDTVYRGCDRNFACPNWVYFTENQSKVQSSEVSILDQKLLCWQSLCCVTHFTAFRMLCSYDEWQ